MGSEAADLGVGSLLAPDKVSPRRPAVPTGWERCQGRPAPLARLRRPSRARSAPFPAARPLADPSLLLVFLPHQHSRPAVPAPPSRQPPPLPPPPAICYLIPLLAAAPTAAGCRGSTEPQPGVSAQRDVEAQRQRTL